MPSMRSRKLAVRSTRSSWSATLFGRELARVHRVARLGCGLTPLLQLVESGVSL